MLIDALHNTQLGMLICFRSERFQKCDVAMKMREGKVGGGCTAKNEKKCFMQETYVRFVFTII